VSQVEIARLTLRLLKIESFYTIAIDRTEWQLGTQWVNVLMLSIAYRSISIPLLWTVLDEKGCSDDQERKEILQKFIDEFGAASIRLVTADREFCSKEWLKYLIEKRISYRLRIKASYQITNARGAVVRASRLCRTLKINQRIELRGKRLLWDKAVFVAVCRKEDGDNVLVISSEQSGKILLEYGERWKIETLFGILKTRGFRLEDTHLTEVERIAKLLSLLTIAVSWAMLAGELEVLTTPLKTKKHGRLEKSIFRLGFETLPNCFCQLTTNFRQKQRFQQLTLLLSCT
jgi:transposase